jgi:DNA repair protein RadC
MFRRESDLKAQLELLPQQEEPPLLCSEPGTEVLLALISTILAFGRVSMSASAAAHRLIKNLGSSRALARATMEEIRFRAKVSVRQAAVLYAALLLGKEICSQPMRAGQKFANSRDLFLRYRARFFSAQREHFLSLHLNSKNQLIQEVLISIGSLNTSVVHPREVFAAAVKDSSAALIFLHNHPSGDPGPSREDRDCTIRLCRAGKILGIRILDHIILGFDDYFSFADAGLLEEGE